MAIYFCALTIFYNFLHSIKVIANHLKCLSYEKDFDASGSDADVLNSLCNLCHVDTTSLLMSLGKRNGGVEVQDSSSEDELSLSKKREKPKELQKESGDDVNMSALCVFSKECHFVKAILKYPSRKWSCVANSPLGV